MKPNNVDEAQRTLQIETFYPHPPERVWSALTDPKALSCWLLPTTFQPCLGSRFTFLHKPGSGKRRRVHCQVVELAAPHRLAYTWQAEDENVPTLVAWTLEPTDAGTRVTLEHIGPAALLAAEQDGMKMLSNMLRQDVSFVALSPEPRRHLGRIVLSAASSSRHCVSRQRIRPAAGAVTRNMPRYRHVCRAVPHEKVQDEKV